MFKTLYIMHITAAGRWKVRVF